MGLIIDSCKSHMACCNTEGRTMLTEPNLNNRNTISEDENEINPTEISEMSGNVEIPKDVVNMKVTINDLIMEHQSSPWEYYKEIKTIGSGTYGTVKKVCLKKDPLTVRAMKIIPKDNVVQGVDYIKVLDEITILKKLDHPNIMKIFECFDDEKNIYIISDFCDQGDLLGKLEKLGKMNEIVVKFLMEQIFNAVAYLHSKNFLHGDIKLENILLYTITSKNRGKRFTIINSDINEMIELRREFRSNSETKRTKNYVNDMLNYEIKLIDFGCSKYFVNKNKHTRLSGIIGTSIYCSPEVVDDLYDELSDEWSCGVLMYILLSGEPPFQGESEEEIFQKIKKCKYDFNPKEFDEVSDNCKDLIKKLLEPNKKKRIKACDALKHPFFTEFFNPSKAMTENKDLNILRKLINTKKPASKFHEAMYAYICNNFLSIDEEKKLRPVFRYIDKEGKNTFLKEELNKCFKEIHIDLSEEGLDEIFKIIDSNRNNKIEYQEFLRVACDKNTLLSDENLRNSFLALNEGEEKEFIDANIIKKFIFHDAEIQDDILNEYLEQFGLKKDEKMNFEQFCDILRNNKKLNEKEQDEVKENDIKSNNQEDESCSDSSSSSNDEESEEKEKTNNDKNNEN